MLKNYDNQFKFGQFRNKMYCYLKPQDSHYNHKATWINSKTNRKIFW